MFGSKKYLFLVPLLTNFDVSPTPFCRTPRALPETELQAGDNVIISSEDGLHIALGMGVIRDISANSVTVLTESHLKGTFCRPSRAAAANMADDNDNDNDNDDDDGGGAGAAAADRDERPLFRLDRSGSLYGSRAVRSNIAALFAPPGVDALSVEAGEPDFLGRLRRLVVDLERPVFALPDERILGGKGGLLHLQTAATQHLQQILKKTTPPLSLSRNRREGVQ